MKRFFDLTISILLLILLSPMMAVIAVVIAIVDGRPVVFTQDRVGKGNQLFKVRKFRTMKNGTRNAAKKDLSEHEDCITPFGRLLRRTSLDELPQLINVIEGSMSLVGPRPLIPEEVEIRELRESYGVYSVLPGLTGWAQVTGRDAISDDEKAILDKEYVERQSLPFDLKILFKTVAVVLLRKDISI